MNPNPERVTALASMIRERAAGTARFVVGIAGAPGAGKSTLAELFREELGEAGEAAVVVPMDGFHFDDVLLNERGHRPRKGAPFTFDVYGFIALLRRIRAGEPEIAIPVFYREEEVAHAGARIIASDARVVVVEGNYLLLETAPWCELRPLFDMTIGLVVPREELERRLMQRWLEHGYDREAARERVASNDMLNVDEVMRKSAAADVVF